MPTITAAGVRAVIAVVAVPRVYLDMAVPELQTAVQETASLLAAQAAAAAAG
jgi:hypothetical protein